MIIRPLFFEWPDINYFYDDNLIDREFLIGTDILCIPILSDKSNYTIGLLPNEPFYNFQTGEETMENLIFLYIGLNQSLPLFIRAGSIIHFQDVKNVKSTRDLNNIFKLFITMNNYNYHASGFLIGFDHLSEENIASCIANDYECIWEIVFNFKILETNDFIFEIEFIPNENTQKNNGTIEIEEIQIMGLKEKIKESLFTMDSGQVYVGNKTGIFMVGEAEMGRENDKTVIKCMISKKFTEKEKFYIRFVNEKQVDLGFIVLFLIGFACFQKIMLSTEEI